VKYVITGSSSGLGYSITQKLMSQGDVIGISRRNRDIVGEQDLECNFKHIKADLSKVDVFSKSSNVIKSLNSCLQDDEFTLVLNAGVFYSGSCRLRGDERVRLFRINLFSIMDLISEMQKMNLKRIFFINSISGLVGQETQHEYASSKHGLMGYIKSLIKDSKNKPYDIMVINPGGIKTELWNEYPAINTDDFLNPDELANVILSLIMIQQRVCIPSFSILPISDI